MKASREQRGHPHDDDGGDQPRNTPTRALVLAAICLALPPVASLTAPEWVDGSGALLVWVPALIPAFLLAYYRGWQGASQALAGAMAALVLTQAEILLLDLPAPSWTLVFGVVLALVVVSIGSGWLADLLREERLAAERMALTDQLTGLPNRRHATVFLETAWAAARRGQALSVVLFDVDHFKRVNDTQGHSAGDHVLKTLGEVLGTRGRAMDVSARLGGEEFVSVLVGCSADAAVSFAEEIRARVAGLRFEWGSVTVSAGVAEYVEGMGAPDVLLAAADRALYAAKDAGRDRVRRADQLSEEPEPDSLAEPEEPSAGDPADGSLDGIAVLLVDDNPGMLRATRRTLEGFGCTVEAFTNPFDALNRVQTGAVTPHVMVTDVVMPEMSGFALVDMMARLVKTLPVLYVSGYNQRDMYWSGAPGTRSAILGKPYTGEELRTELVDLLAPHDAKHPRVARAKAPATPASEAPAPAAPTEVATAPAQDRTGVRNAHEGKILIVDDEPMLLRALKRLFVENGHSPPETTADPLKALEIVEQWDPDLVILDIHMPQVDGFEILSRLRELAGDELLPVIVFSGDPDPKIRRRALELGATDFLNKPLETTEALVRVRNALRIRFLHSRVLADRDELERRVAERTQELTDTRTEVLHRLARAAEYRDDVTGRHAARVGLLSSLIASELGMTPEDRELIRRTAPLHDIGKIGVPDRVLHKAGPLTDEEFEIVKRHTLIGARILEGGRHRILRMARDIAESHHERWDGTGYPHGAAGSDIPIEARIVAAADTFDVLTHTRPYKNPKTPEEAVAEIIRCRGTHFDPRVADAVAAICARVGAEALPALVDPVDPWQDTRPNPPGVRPAGTGSA